MRKKLLSISLALLMIFQILIPTNIFAKEAEEADLQNVKVENMDKENYLSLSPKNFLESIEAASTSGPSMAGSWGPALFMAPGGPPLPSQYIQGQQPSEEDKPKYLAKVQAEVAFEGLDGKPFDYENILGRDANGQLNTFELRFTQTLKSTLTGVEKIQKFSGPGTYEWLDGLGQAAEFPLFDRYGNGYEYNAQQYYKKADKNSLLISSSNSTPKVSFKQRGDEHIATIFFEQSISQCAATNFSVEWKTGLTASERPQLHGKYTFIEDGAPVDTIFDFQKQDGQRTVLRYGYEENFVEDEENGPWALIPQELSQTPTVTVDTSTPGLTFNGNGTSGTVEYQGKKFRYNFTYDVIKGGHLTMTEIIPITFTVANNKIDEFKDKNPRFDDPRIPEADNTKDYIVELPYGTPIWDYIPKNVKRDESMFIGWANYPYPPPSVAPIGEKILRDSKATKAMTYYPLFYPDVIEYDPNGPWAKLSTETIIKVHVDLTDKADLQAGEKKERHFRVDYTHPVTLPVDAPKGKIEKDGDGRSFTWKFTGWKSEEKSPRVWTIDANNKFIHGQFHEDENDLWIRAQYEKVYVDNKITIDEKTVYESFKDAGGNFVNNFLPTLDQVKGQVKFIDAQGNLVALPDNVKFEYVPGQDSSGNAYPDFDTEIYDKLKEKDNINDEPSRIEKIKAKITFEDGEVRNIEIPIKVLKNIYEAKTLTQGPFYVPGEFKKVIIDPTSKAQDYQKLYYYVNPAAEVVVPITDPTARHDMGPDYNNLTFEKWTTGGPNIADRVDFDKNIRHKFTDDKTTITARYSWDPRPIAEAPTANTLTTVLGKELTLEDYKKAITAGKIGGDSGPVAEIESYELVKNAPVDKVVLDADSLIDVPVDPANPTGETKQVPKNYAEVKVIYKDGSVHLVYVPVNVIDSVIEADDNGNKKPGTPDDYVKVTFVYTDKAEGNPKDRIFYVSPQVKVKFADLQSPVAIADWTFEKWTIGEPRDKRIDYDAGLERIFSEDTVITARYSFEWKPLEELEPKKIDTLDTPAGKTPSPDELKAKITPPDGKIIESIEYVTDGKPDYSNPGKVEAKIVVKYTDGTSVGSDDNPVVIPVVVHNPILPSTDGKKPAEAMENYVKISFKAGEGGKVLPKTDPSGQVTSPLIYYVSPEVEVDLTQYAEDIVKKPDTGYIKDSWDTDNTKKFKNKFASDTEFIFKFKEAKVQEITTYIGKSPSKDDFKNAIEKPNGITIEEIYFEEGQGNPDVTTPIDPAAISEEKNMYRTEQVKLIAKDSEGNFVPVTVPVKVYANVIPADDAGNPIAGTPDGDNVSGLKKYVKVTFKPTEKATDATKAEKIYYVNPEAVVALPAPTVEGKTVSEEGQPDITYVFTGWDKAIEGTFAEDTEITALYKKSTPAKPIVPIPQPTVGFILTDEGKKPSLEDYIGQIFHKDKSDDWKYEITEEPDVSKEGLTFAKIKVTFPDGSSTIVKVPVGVKKDKVIVEPCPNPNPNPPTPDNPDQPDKPNKPDKPVVNIDGKNRQDVAVNIARNYFGNARKVILVQDMAYADSMSAMNISKGQIPILYTGRDTLYDITREEILRTERTEIIVVGGPNTISPEVFRQVQALNNGKVTRVDGIDRFEVNKNSLAYFGQANKAVIASGMIYTDALSSVRYADYINAPILLVNKDKVPEVIAYELKNYFSEAVLAGGPNTVSDMNLANIEALVGSSVERINGADRYVVSANLAARLPDPDQVIVTSGENWSDALVAGPLAQRIDAPVLLTAGASLPMPIRNYLAKLGKLSNIYVIGGPASISSAVRKTLDSYIVKEKAGK